MEVSLQKLREFRKEATFVGYESENPKYKILEKNKSKTIWYKSGDFEYNDNYFGGEPYGGRTVIFYKNSPVWLVVYYGALEGNYDPDEIYSFLRKALKAPKESDLRGPKEFMEMEFIYKNVLEGTLEKFSGEERIYKGKNLAYIGKYSGGLVDQREGE